MKRITVLLVENHTRNDAVEFPGSAAASAAVRRALAPNLHAADTLIGSRSRPPMPTTRASSAAPEAGALPHFNCIVPDTIVREGLWTLLEAEADLELDTPAAKVASGTIVILSYPRSHKNPLE